MFLLIILLIIFLNNKIFKEGFSVCSSYFSNNLNKLNEQPKTKPLKGIENINLKYKFIKEKLNQNNKKLKINITKTETPPPPPPPSSIKIEDLI